MSKYYLADRETGDALDENGESVLLTGADVKFYATMDAATDALDSIEYARIREVRE